MTDNRRRRVIVLPKKTTAAVDGYVAETEPQPKEYVKWTSIHRVAAINDAAFHNYVIIAVVYILKFRRNGKVHRNVAGVGEE